MWLLKPWLFLVDLWQDGPGRPGPTMVDEHGNELTAEQLEVAFWAMRRACGVQERFNGGS